MPPLEVFSQSESDTERIGQALARVLQPGDVVALDGDLGAGKTRLVRAIVLALDGADLPVNSPTFVIVQRYDVQIPVYHVDAYRLRDPEEFLALGGDEILESDGICLIEWAERIVDALPKDRLSIHISHVSQTSRRLRCVALGPTAASRLEALSRILENA